MAGAPYTTQWIGDCIRGRKLTSMERAIQHLTDAPAQLFGLKDRGRIAVGYHADLVLFDPETIDAGSIELVSDLPGDTGRLMAEAIGVHRVIVGGVDIVVDGVPTDALPGRIIRSGADTETVSLG
jgi:N-acyl-D-aspartate/D-glutamate deacylase